MTDPLRVTLIAGEPSGDQLGAHLMAGLRAETDGKVTFSGIGGTLMAAEGLDSLFPMSDLSVMGLVEVLPRLPHLLRRVREAADHVIASRADVLVTIDSPDFCLRVAKRVKAARPDLRTVHYVAPSVWAWRPGRAQKMARSIDHVLALLPFEPPYMEAAGMTCDMVGHPVAGLPVVPEAARAAFRQDLGLTPDTPLLCLLPGSRQGEVARHSAAFAETVGLLRRTHPDLAVVIPAAPPVADRVTAMSDAIPGLHVLDPRNMTPETAQTRKWTAMAAAQAALAVSGTVSLELAAQGTPMVIGYTANPISRMLMKRLVRIDTATLVNLVSETRAVPEFIFDDFDAPRMAKAVAQLLSDPEARTAQREAADITMIRLGRGGDDPGLRAARSVLATL